jgi:two-component system sensor histidine kinase CpxA
MTVRSLWTKILLAAVVNVSLVLALLAMAGVLPWPRTLEDLAIWSAGDDVVDLARRVALELGSAGPGEYDRVLEEYSPEARATLVLARNDGVVVAGRIRDLPNEVRERLMMRPDPRPGRPPEGADPPFGDGRRAPFAQGRAGLPREGRPGGPPFEGRPAAGPADGRSGGPQRGAGGRGRRGGPPGAPPFFVQASTAPRYWMGARIPIPDRAGEFPMPGVLLVASDRLFGAALLRPTMRSGVLIAAGIAITALCWIPLLRGMTRAIDQLEHATGYIAHGRFDHRADESRRDELGSLAQSVNKMAARLDRAAADQTRFLGDTAHELRSPLGRVQVALEILQTKASQAEQPYLTDLREDVDELTALTNELLEFARTKLTSPASAPEAIEISELVNDVVRVERQSADVRVELSPGLRVYAHRREFARALGNILRNAVRYAGAQGPIVIAARQQQERVEISVADSGPGVPADAIDQLFTPFFRIETSRTRRSGGAGLGLAIARTAIEACGGTISCRNRPTGGLEIAMSLPAFGPARIS